MIILKEKIVYYSRTVVHGPICTDNLSNFAELLLWVFFTIFSFLYFLYLFIFLCFSFFFCCSFWPKEVFYRKAVSFFPLGRHPPPTPPHLTPPTLLRPPTHTSADDKVISCHINQSGHAHSQQWISNCNIAVHAYAHETRSESRSAATVRYSCI